MQWLQVPFLWGCPCSVAREMSHSCQGSKMLCGLLHVTGYGWPWLKRDRALGALETCELVWRQRSGWVHSNLEKRETTKGKSRKVKSAKRVGGIKNTELVEKCVCLCAVVSFTICQNFWALPYDAVYWLTDRCHSLIADGCNIDQKPVWAWHEALWCKKCACINTR